MAIRQMLRSLCLHSTRLPRRLLGCFGTAGLLSTVLMSGSPCQEQTLSPQVRANANRECNHEMCDSGSGCRMVPGLQFKGKHACASLPVDFKRFNAIQATFAPRVAPAVPIGPYNKLHSRPSATKVIYLDFDGSTTTDPWSSTPIVTTAYDIDSNPTSFSAQEQANIIEIWQRVSECYSIYDVDVTTEAPSIADLINTGGGDTKWGMRVLFGTSNPSPAPSAGGVAFLFSFGDSNSLGEDVPCFVLQPGVGTSPKTNADAAVHEVGHTLGLSHDGLNTATAQNGGQSQYYLGHGSGKVGWAPHMGAGYYVPIVQWSKGEYFDANNFQDDVTIIPQVGGFGLRPDDFANSQGAAKAIPGTAGAKSFAVSVSGVIETRNDTDWFKITAGSGAVKFDAVGGPVNTMLDIQLTLYDSKGAVVVAANPVNDVIASINQSVPSGTYFLKIEGVGMGDPLGVGYTDYGSVGQYTITGSFSTVGLKGAPVLSTTGDLFYGVKEGPKVINPNIKVADPDNMTLPSATVTITNPVVAQDVLSLVSNPATMGNITSSYDTASATLTLTSAGATATLAQFQAALRAVSYSNTSTNPANTPRKVNFQVSDGVINSNILTSTVTIGYYYVTVSYNAGVLTINDDVGDNSVAVTVRGNQIYVETAGATRIGNSASSTQSKNFPYTGTVVINGNFTGGNDAVSLVSVKASNVTLNLGEGNDSVSLTYCNITTKLTVNGGNGTDVVKPVGTTIAATAYTSVP